MSCYAMQFHVVINMPGHVMSCHGVMSCHVISCHVSQGVMQVNWGRPEHGNQLVMIQMIVIEFCEL